MDARVDDVCIHDLYELVRERLKADDVHGLFVDPEEHPSQNAELCGGPSWPSERAPGYVPAVTTEKRDDRNDLEERAGD